MGCGHAHINRHFQDNERFTFYNFDHIACNELVTVKDINNTGLDDYSVDIAILSRNGEVIVKIISVRHTEFLIKEVSF